MRIVWVGALVALTCFGSAAQAETAFVQITVMNKGVSTDALDPDVQTWPGIEATTADEISAYLMQGLARERLVKLYPNLPDAELETLMRRIEAYASKPIRQN